MQCYTIGTVNNDTGLWAMPREQGWIVQVGFKPRVELLIPRRRQEGLNRFKAALEQRAGGDTRFISLLDEDEVVEMQAAKEALEEISLGVALCDLDVVDGKLVDLRHTKAAAAALVNVLVCVNKESSSLQYFAGFPEELELDGRVHRVNRAFDQVVGVETVAQGLGFFGETQALLRMLPGSAFRLGQTTPQEGAWEELYVRWTGQRLIQKPFFPRGPKE